MMMVDDYNKQMTLLFRVVLGESTITTGTSSHFSSGPSAWPHVLTATRKTDGVASRNEQSFTMNVTALPRGWSKLSSI